MDIRRQAELRRQLDDEEETESDDDNWLSDDSGGNKGAAVITASSSHAPPPANTRPTVKPSFTAATRIPPQPKSGSRGSFSTAKSVFEGGSSSNSVQALRRERARRDQLEREAEERKQAERELREKRLAEEKAEEARLKAKAQANFERVQREKEEARRKKEEENEKRLRIEAERRDEEQRRRIEAEAEEKARQEELERERARAKAEAQAQAEKVKAREEAKKQAERLRQVEEERARQAAQAEAEAEAERNRQAEEERLREEKRVRQLQLAEEERIRAEEAKLEEELGAEEARVKAAEEEAKRLEAERQELEEERIRQEADRLKKDRAAEEREGALLREEEDRGRATKVYIAEYPFSGEQEEDLSFAEGDRISLLEELDENWWRGRLVSSGAEGVFPKGYVKLDESAIQSAEEAPPEVVPAPATLEEDSTFEEGDNVYYIAEYDFEATEESDLGFVCGEIIEELEQLDSEWYRGRIGEREGMFPSAYVTLYTGSKQEAEAEAEAEEAESAPIVESSGREAETEKYVAAYDYESEEQGDLPFSTGEVIEVLEKIDESWWRGRIADREGIFPATFVELS